MSAADLAADLVLRWGVTYTRDLDAASADDRLHELASDLHEQLAHERAARRPEALIAASVLRRATAGAGADLAWRRDVLRMRLPRAARVRLAVFRTLDAAAALIAAALVVLGTASYLSASRWLPTASGINVPQSLYLLIPATITAAVASGLLVARSTRRIGMFLLAGAALVIPWLALNVLTTTSSLVGGVVLSFRPLDPAGWQLAAAGTGIALCLVVLLATVGDRRAITPPAPGRSIR